MTALEAPWRWTCDSSESGEAHLVDLLGENGNGECSCKDFQIRRRPKLREGHASSRFTRCKHIDLARDLALNMIIHAERTS